MFCDEARLCALLHHPNVVQVYDFGQIGGSYFLAMEYLRGKDLSAVMKALRARRAAVKPSVAAYIAQQVATGLQYAHTLTRMDGRALGIVHRDVTPSNIMLQRTGAVKVLDFGIAQATNLVRQAETGGGRVKGKLAYLSPEQVRIEELDTARLFARRGAWEMLVERLFPGENEFTPANVLLCWSRASRRAEVPAADASSRALEREPGDRGRPPSVPPSSTPPGRTAVRGRCDPDLLATAQPGEARRPTPPAGDVFTSGDPGRRRAPPGLDRRARTERAGGSRIAAQQARLPAPVRRRRGRRSGSRAGGAAVVIVLASGKGGRRGTWSRGPSKGPRSPALIQAARKSPVVAQVFDPAARSVSTSR
jgi:hypothetical protein